MDEYLSTEQAAELLGTSVAVLGNLRYRGGGPVFAKVGARVIYKRSDIAEWIDANRYSRTGQKAEAYGS